MYVPWLIQEFLIININVVKNLFLSLQFSIHPFKYRYMLTRYIRRITVGIGGGQVRSKGRQVSGSGGLKAVIITLFWGFVAIN